MLVAEGDFDPRVICESGQMFRFLKKKEDYFLFSKNDAAKLMKFDGKYAIISSNEEYFRNYFDLDSDYLGLSDRLCARPEIAEAVRFGKGMRILRQDSFETTVCFLISQNNRISRITGIVARLCEALGEEREFEDVRYRTFPTAERMAAMDEDFYRSLGAGYRAPYLLGTARMAAETDFAELSALSDEALGERLLQFPGVGPKVKDCIALFGFGRCRAFPVDTWIEKVYRTLFHGRETDRRKMTAYFEQSFGTDSGLVQQMLFYYARNNSGVFHPEK